MKNSATFLHRCIISTTEDTVYTNSPNFLTGFHLNTRFGLPLSCDYNSAFILSSLPQGNIYAQFGDDKLTLPFAGWPRPDALQKI